MRIEKAPKIDGMLNDECWKLCDSISDFYQYLPVYLAPPSQRTVVRIAYDNEAIYIGAMMYDSAPDSILKELGNRDDENLNADKFGVEFDTYNLQSDATTFIVWASGVQLDYRANDNTYSSVWQSAVKHHENGWSCEMKIFYSSLRFPKTDEQVWGLQILRGIRRYRELDYWSPEKKGSGNRFVGWGKLKGIRNIEPPLRLSFTPFVALYADHYPYNTKGVNNFSYSASGGLDMKYGINESYTLDMTLLPDFSQVQSDEQVKNISAFETVYEEHRPFFTEAVDLFDIGGLFYSRRIGRTPQKYYSVYGMIDSTEYVYKNPNHAKLLNAFKISGRNTKGLALGVFNAITGNTYAIIKDSSGNERKILTEPLTNYNIFVYDQILKNNSKISFVNTNVLRDKKYDDANVTYMGTTINDKKIRYRFNASAALSQKYHRDTTKMIYKNTLGYKYDISFRKVSGNFLFNIFRNQMNDTWDCNDMGLVLENNRTTTGISFSYNIYEPFGKLRNMYNTLNIYHTENYLTKKITDFNLGVNSYYTTRKYLSVWHNASLNPFLINNYAEPRRPNRYVVNDRSFYVNTGISSDYRKTFAIDASVDYWQELSRSGKFYSLSVSPIIRFSDNLTLRIGSSYQESLNDIGYVFDDDLGNIIMGKRNITTVVNKLNARYIFLNNLSLSLTARHYWSKGRYNQFYKLSSDGQLIIDPMLTVDEQYNFNFNAFNIDMMFFWEFAPGSSLNITYKNNISKDSSIIVPSYFRNLGRIFSEKQLNSLTVKVLYYLDYQQVKKVIKKKKDKNL